MEATDASPEEAPGPRAVAVPSVGTGGLRAVVLVSTAAALGGWSAVRETKGRELEDM